MSMKNFLNVLGGLGGTGSGGVPTYPLVNPIFSGDARTGWTAAAASPCQVSLGDKLWVSAFTTNYTFKMPTSPNSGSFFLLSLEGNTTGTVVATFDTAFYRYGEVNSSSTTLTPQIGNSLLAFEYVDGRWTCRDTVYQTNYSTSTGSANAYVLALNPKLGALVTNATYIFKSNFANTGAATLNIDTLGATSIVKVQGGIATALAANDILSGQECVVIYDGTNFQIISGLGNASGGGVSLSANNTWTGIQTFTPAARASGVAPYFEIDVPTDTGITAATEAIGFKYTTGTRTWATTGTVALQEEIKFAGPTYASASPSQTFTDAATVSITPPVAGTNAIFTRGHSLLIADSTSAATAITGAVMVANAGAIGTAATSVGIGAGNIFAGGSITAQSNISSNAGSLIAASSNNIGFSGLTVFTTNTDGIMTLAKNGLNGFTRLNFGFTSSGGTPSNAAAIGFDAVNGFTLQGGAGSSTWNDGSTANSGTVANRYLFGIAAPTLSSTGTSVTDTVASSFYIGGPPVAGTNTTIGTAYSLNVAAGNSTFGGAYTVGALPSGATTAGVTMTYPAATYTVTGTNTATAYQAIYHGVPTFTDASAGTVTDLFNEVWAGPPVVAGSLTGTRKHSIGIVDSTSAASSITGAFVISTTLGTTGTSIGMGGGNINAGGIVQANTFIANGSSAGAINNFKNVATTGFGVPIIYGQGRSTAQIAAVASVAAYTNAATDGTFVVYGNVNVTAATTASITMTCTYTDETNTSRTATFSFVQNGVAVPIQTITNVTGVGAYAGMPLTIRSKASTSITLATTGTFTSVTYNVGGSIQQID